MKKGICYLVGAGAGDEKLLTLRAAELLECADVVVYDELINPNLLQRARENAQFIPAGKRAGKHRLAQNQTNQLLIRLVRQGKTVVRLKGGDPLLFGRGAEEAEALRRAKCAFEIVPGIPSAIAASAYAGIPLTHRRLASGVTFVTGHEEVGKKQPAVDWKKLARSNETLVIHMGLHRLGEIVRQLHRHGMNGSRPVAVVENASFGCQKTAAGRLDNIVERVRRQKIQPPALIIIGDVVSKRKTLDWFETKPLVGQRIVLTRTRRQMSRTKDLLKELGAEVLELPTIRLAPKKLRQKPKLKNFDWVFFTSPSAVDIFFETCVCDARELAKLKFAVIGPATGTALKRYLIRPDWMPSVFTNEAFVRQWRKQKRKQRALYPCSDLAGGILIEGLKKKNVRVDRLETYRALTEHSPALAPVVKQLELHGADWIIFASSSAVKNYHALNLELPQQPKIASIGPVTSCALRELGYCVNLESEESRIESLVKRVH